jgi:hypothetical protein
MDKAAVGVLGVLAGVYLVRVGLAGNHKQLLQELAKEGHYLEVLAALFALWVIWKYGPNPGGFTHSLMMTAGIAAFLNTAFRNVNVSQALQDFGAGKKSLLDTAKSIFGQ